MKAVFLTVLALFSFTARAATKGEIWELLQRIDGEIRYYDQTPDQLEQAKSHLDGALAALRGVPGGDPQACIDFALAKYRDDGYSNSTSLQKAGDWCRAVSARNASLEVLAFFFVKLRDDGYSNATSLDKALSMGGNLPRAQLTCVQRAFATYREDGYSNSTSLQKAAEFCKN